MHVAAEAVELGHHDGRIAVIFVSDAPCCLERGGELGSPCQCIALGALDLDEALDHVERLLLGEPRDGLLLCFEPDAKGENRATVGGVGSSPNCAIRRLGSPIGRTEVMVMQRWHHAELASGVDRLIA
jgi:hypothetical protein